MKKTKQSTMEIANNVQKTIREVQKVIDAVVIMKPYKWFNNNQFQKSGMNALIRDTCKRNGISEKHIRTVAGW